MTLPDTMIDLRSDTVTRPSAAMREVMARAPVGDMQYGDDPSLNALEERVAGMLGKEASLWLPSGTMANQVALRVLTRPGDDVLVGSEAHSVWHEAGGSAANAGVQFTEIGSGGLFTAADVRRHAKPRDQPVLPLPATTLVQIENTHNRHGGLVFPQADVEAVCAAARELRLATYQRRQRGPLRTRAVAQSRQRDRHFLRGTRPDGAAERAAASGRTPLAAW